MAIPRKDHDAQARQFVANCAAWFRQNLKIIDKQGQLIPLEPNAEQLWFLYWVGRQMAAGVPVRILILKYRRGGFSTIVTALFYMLTATIPNRKAFGCAHDAEGTGTLSQIMHLYHDEMPPKVKKSVLYDNPACLVWPAPHRSSYRLHTAGSKNLGRSKEVHHLHISERAFIEHPETSLLAVLQCVSDVAGTIIISESTANGATGEFYDTWNQAVKARMGKSADDVSGTLPLFFGWLQFPEYRMAVPEGYQWGELDEYEQELVRLGADHDQLYWRRVILHDKCLGDPEKFCQEYPATPLQAFRSSGRPAIPMSIINHHASMARSPERRVVLCRDDQGKVQVGDAKPGEQLVWHVWFEPDATCDYSVAGDIMEGAAADPTNPGSEPDWSTGVVLNRRYLRVDATLQGRADPDLVGEQLRLCGEWYRNAWSTPELNNAGHAAIVAFKRPTPYHNTYQRQKPPEHVNEGQEQPLYGWKTTTGNRDLMIDTYLSFARPHPVSGFQDRIVVFDERIVDEERSFVRKKDGKREHQEGQHDDLLFALFIALMLHLECPRGRIVQYPDQALASRHNLSADYTGGRDDEDEDRDQDEVMG